MSWRATGLADAARRYARLWSVVLAEECRRAGRAVYSVEIVVVEVAGWRGRGFDYPDAPTVVVDHHTASPDNGPAPALGLCINGRPAYPQWNMPAVAGPLSNIVTSREHLLNGRLVVIVYVVADGKSNNAGTGTAYGETSNYGTMGNERENKGDGSEPWTPGERAAARIADVAMLSLMPAASRAVPKVIRHATWATPPGRKVDSVDETTADLQADVRWLLTLNPDDPSPEEDDMFSDEDRALLREVKGLLTTGMDQRLAALLFGVEKEVGEGVTGPRPARTVDEVVWRNGGGYLAAAIAAAPSMSLEERQRMWDNAAAVYENYGGDPNRLPPRPAE